MDNNFKDKFPQAKSFEDFRSEISIIELATAYGYHQEIKKGLRTPVFYNPAYNDRIIIMDPQNPGNQGYWNPEDDTDKGTLINFVKRRLGSIFPLQEHAGEHANINRVLYQYLRLSPFTRQQYRNRVSYAGMGQVEATKFRPETYSLEPVSHTGFLDNRQIGAETLKLPEFVGRIFNATYLNQKKSGVAYTNTVFPYYVATHNKMVGLEIRNTDFMSHAEGSDRSHGVWHSNMPARLDRIVMVESALDALSYQELQKQKNNLYISYGGNLSLSQISTILQLKAKAKASDYFHFVSATDNDKKGAYYDLMFIRHLAASQVPSQRVANPRNYIRLIFPDFRQQSPMPQGPANLQQFAQTLMDSLQAYNDQREQAPKTGESLELDKQKILFELTAGQLEVLIPNSFLALNAFNQKFILAAGLQYDVRIDKALLNDYNEDLKLIKQVNNHPELLAELNKKDLRRAPAVPLSYLDLKFVMLQPGRYEQMSKLFGLVKNEEAGNPVLKFGKKKDAQQATPQPAKKARK